MRSRSRVLAVLPFMLALLGARADSAVVVYAVVVAEDVPLTDITLDELRRVFLMKRAFWKPGKPIRLVLPASGLPARTFLLQYVCQKTEGEMRRLVLESMSGGSRTSHRRWPTRMRRL